MTFTPHLHFGNLRLARTCGLFARIAAHPHLPHCKAIGDMTAVANRRRGETHLYRQYRLKIQSDEVGLSGSSLTRLVACHARSEIQIIDNKLLAPIVLEEQTRTVRPLWD